MKLAVLTHFVIGVVLLVAQGSVMPTDGRQTSKTPFLVASMDYGLCSDGQERSS